jgi:hypothetical protein
VVGELALEEVDEHRIMVLMATHVDEEAVSP